ncbi:alpha/beta fold hydrolase [Modestobacter sp. I12A-02662]|uniref:alpha/beta fold hydrolase n=1 Tax=Modestobacter sp. I12A-02662 TaxID=1730496 RepID=UPI0034DE7BD0
MISSVEANGVPDFLWVPGMGLDERSSARVRSRVGGRVLSLPGMGLRTQVPAFPGLVQRLRDRPGVAPVVLVGHSQSCLLVAAAAVGDPRVVGLLLLGPTPDPRLRRFAVLAARWVRTAAHEPWWQVPLVLRQWLHTGPRAMAALWRQTVRERLDEVLRRVGVPVVVVRGERDALVPRDWALRLAGCAPDGRLVELPGAAHMVVHTRPDDVARIVRELAAELAG